MKLHECKQWLEDIDEVLDLLPELHELASKVILITGATGLIGSALVDVLTRYNDTHDIPIRIVVAGRDLRKCEERFWLRNDVIYISYDSASGSNRFDQHFDYIVHGASNAFPSAIASEPVETMLSNFLGMKELLDYAKVNGTKRVLFISSSEVYGLKDSNEPLNESDYGYVDLLNARNSYSIGKRAAETLCSSYHDEYGVESVIVRPGHVYGPSASRNDNRVASAWTYAAARGENLYMKSDGEQIRSYCYCLDTASAILKAMICGDSCQAYNISNPDSILSIKSLGELLAKVAGVQLLRVEATKVDAKSFNPMTNSSLNSDKLMSLGWRPLFSAERGFTHTVEILKRIEII